MTDLIDRQAAIDALLNGKIDEDESLVECPAECNAMIDGAIEDIKALPSAQPERKRGKWVKENIVLTSNPPQYMWHCSVCGKLMHWFNDSVLTSFCPNCGAEME